MKRAYVQTGQLDEWQVLEGSCQSLTCTKKSELLSFLREIEARCLRDSLYFFGAVSYEAANAFDEALSTHEPTFPLLTGAFYSTRTMQDRKSLLEKNPGEMHSKLPKLEWKPMMSFSEYKRCFDSAQKELLRGNAYQVNLCFQLLSSFSGDSSSLFFSLAVQSACRFGAFFESDEHAILSFSPELFLARRGSRLISRPMKGTRKRLPEFFDDQAQAKELYQSEKDRAENVMIVDMMRNDLTRISTLPSVKTSRLFELEQYPQVWQMTSTVESQSPSSLAEIFQACFPAASITGAPKSSSMRIIRSLEQAPRGVYTGSLLFIEPNGDFTANVAIRSMIFDKRKREISYGVGSGITVGSSAESEYEECLMKAPLLLSTPLFLRETLRWSPEEGFYNGEAHLLRLRRSADYFGISFHMKAAQKMMLSHSQDWKDDKPRRIALHLDMSGCFSVEVSEFEPWPKKLTLRLSSYVISSTWPWVYHKSNQRQCYDQAYSTRGDADDVILINERGELTETCRANFALRKDGLWYTPPVSSGLLAGIERAHRIQSGLLHEKKLYIEDLLHNPEIIVFNSLRGEAPAEVEKSHIESLLSSRAGAPPPEKMATL